MPGASRTDPTGIDGSYIVGGYEEASGVGHGFLYNGATWTTLDMPDAYRTWASGIDGSNIVGHYYDDFGVHGFLYDGSGWTTLDVPGVAGGTQAFGIDGSNIVGSYYDYDTSNWRGFLYNGSSWTILDMPGADYTFPYGIDGSNIVGEYYDASSGSHGFLYTIPEPATLLILGLGVLCLRSARQKVVISRNSNV
jgi:hypothetical protein